MKLLFVSLGCDKNLVDSEFMLGLLSDAGFEFTNEEVQADVIVINTCAFINDAKEESINTILEMAEYKKSGRLKALIVTGCLAQRYEKEIKDLLPEVDAVLGTNSWDCIVDTVRETLESQNGTRLKPLETPPEQNDADMKPLEDQNDTCLKPLETLPEQNDADMKPLEDQNGTVLEPLETPPDYCGRRILTKGTHSAYLKIAEGCDKRCTYCIIPAIRGPYRSVALDSLVAQAELLVAEGVKELVLVAQETTVYGLDLYGEKSLHVLLRKLSEIPRLKWIRIMYCYPEEIYPQLIEEIKTNKKVCHYLDLPIQHANDDILHRMARRTTKQELTETLARLRREIPDIALRTTVICGFPGETQTQHEELMYFLNEMEFDRLGAFPYSQEEGTVAAGLPHQVAEETKQRWHDEVMELNEEIIADKNESLVGSVFEVMVEGYAADADAYVCRTYRDAPEIDGYFFLNTAERLHTGDFVRVRATGAYEYDLIGELV